jgi:hypothetical protein
MSDAAFAMIRSALLLQDGLRRKAVTCAVVEMVRGMFCGAEPITSKNSTGYNLGSGDA